MNVGRVSTTANMRKRLALALVYVKQSLGNYIKSFNILFCLHRPLNDSGSDRESAGCFFFQVFPGGKGKM